MGDLILKFKDFVPLFQNILWVIFLIIILVVNRKLAKDLIVSLIDRIKKGSSFRLGSFELGEKLQCIDYAEQTEKKSGSKGTEREKNRTGIYEKNHGMFLTHILVLSKRREYKYDIYIYLIRHSPIDQNEKYFLDVSSAEYFFGHMWGNEVFKVKPKKGIIGISTSAYAPFLCTCIVKMKDGSEIELYKYIDFEMGIYI